VILFSLDTDTALNDSATQCISVSYREKHSYLENCLPTQCFGVCRCRSRVVFSCLHSTLLAASGICARYVTTFLDVSQISCLHDTWKCSDIFFPFFLSFFLSFFLFLFFSFFFFFFPRTLAATVAWEQTVGVGQVEVVQSLQLQQNMLTYTWDAVRSVLSTSLVVELLRPNVVPDHITRALCSLRVKSTIFAL